MSVAQYLEDRFQRASDANMADTSSGIRYGLGSACRRIWESPNGVKPFLSYYSEEICGGEGSSSNSTGDIDLAITRFQFSRRTLPPSNSCQISSTSVYDQVTKLRPVNRDSQIAQLNGSHTPQVTAPRSKPVPLNNKTNGIGYGGNSNGVSNASGSSSYPSSESSIGRPISPQASLVSGLCQGFMGLNCKGGEVSNLDAVATAAASSTTGGTYSGFSKLSSIGNGLDFAKNASVVADYEARNVDEAIAELHKRTGYPIVQRNGQRIYGPPPNWDRDVPTKGSEVFVGRVPRDCYEHEIVPVFETIGQIYELRLMMDFSGSNRGFFFVRYTCRQDAKRAVAQLNNYEIRPGKRLGVLMSMDNNKLWVSGIPNNVSAEDIKMEMDCLTEGVKDVILYRSPTDKSRPRKYAFVEYTNHRAAALARRRLVPAKITIKGQEIEKVDWAEPQNEVDEEIMSTVKVLFVRNLTSYVSEENLRMLFERWSANGSGEVNVERVKKAKDYAFVHFTSRNAAERAKVSAEGKVIDGELIHVEWSKPVDKNIYNARKYLTEVLSGGGDPYTSRNQPAHFFCTPRMDGGIFTRPSSSFEAMNQPLWPMDESALRGIVGPPRKRGAAGISGLGAPGTPPPRNLLRRLVSMSAVAGPTSMRSDAATYRIGGERDVNGLPNGLAPDLSPAAQATAAAAFMASNGTYDNIIARALNELKQREAASLYPPSTHMNGGQAIMNGLNNVGSVATGFDATTPPTTTAAGFFPFGGNPNEAALYQHLPPPAAAAAAFLNPFLYQNALNAAAAAAVHGVPAAPNGTVAMPPPPPPPPLKQQSPKISEIPSTENSLIAATEAVQQTVAVMEIKSEAPVKEERVVE